MLIECTRKVKDHQRRIVELWRRRKMFEEILDEDWSIVSWVELKDIVIMIDDEVGYKLYGETDKYGTKMNSFNIKRYSY